MESEVIDYIYHIVPSNLEGTTLYPLNVLKNIYPDKYEEHRSKYEGREELMDFIIPHLNCLWNDVLFFLPFHPNQIYKEIIKHFPHIRDRKNLQFYKIPINKINTKNAVFFLDISKKESIRMDYTCEMVDSADAICETSVLDIQKKYFEEKGRSGEKRPYLFSKTTHFILKDFVDIGEVEIVSWSNSL